MITREQQEAIADRVIARMQEECKGCFLKRTQPLTVRVAVFMAIEEAVNLITKEVKAA